MTDPAAEDVAQLAQAAIDLSRRAARFHKWAARKHSEQVKTLLQSAEQLEADCARLAIPIQPTTSAGGTGARRD